MGGNSRKEGIELGEAGIKQTCFDSWRVDPSSTMILQKYDPNYGSPVQLTLQ